MGAYSPRCAATMLGWEVQFPSKARLCIQGGPAAAGLADVAPLLGRRVVQVNGTATKYCSESFKLNYAPYAVRPCRRRGSVGRAWVQMQARGRGGGNSGALYLSARPACLCLQGSGDGDLSDPNDPFSKSVELNTVGGIKVGGIAGPAQQGLCRRLAAGPPQALPCLAPSPPPCTSRPRPTLDPAAQALRRACHACLPCGPDLCPHRLGHRLRRLLRQQRVGLWRH